LQHSWQCKNGGPTVIELGVSSTPFLKPTESQDKIYIIRALIAGGTSDLLACLKNGSRNLEIWVSDGAPMALTGY